MILFTSHRCTRCMHIHEVFGIEALDVKEVLLTQENAEGLAELAWLGLVEDAQRSLPILVEDDGTVRTRMEEIVEALCRRAKEVLVRRISSSPAEEARPLGGRGVQCRDGACRLN